MNMKERSIAPLTGVVRPKKTVDKENITITIQLVPGGVPMLVFLLFLTLKLTGAVAWSWLWITSPLWLPALLVFIGAVVAVIVAAKKSVDKSE